MARARRSGQTSDMVRSLLVILVPLIIITVLFTRLPSDHPVKTVDWTPVLAAARQEAPFPVLAPTRLPAEWRATRVTWTKTGEPGLNNEPSIRNQWELGFLDPDNVYIAVVQGDRQADALVKDQTRAGTSDGTSTIRGTKWDRLVSPDGRTRSLVQRAPEVSDIVVGDLPYAALEAFASTLATS